MRKIFVIMWLISAGIPYTCLPQEVSPSTEQQLENLTATEETETEDDSYWQQLEQFRRHPVNLNTAGVDELEELGVLTSLQIAHLASYRDLLGRFIDIHELQAVPGWDMTTIKRLLPFIAIDLPFDLKENMKVRLMKGSHSLLMRVSQVLEKAEGYKATGGERRYGGSPQHVFFRYRYSYKNLLQFGIVGDKDAGERFLGGAQRYGFDFYSLHFFARGLGAVRYLALGDFTVNMGQGLIQWQSMAFKKSSQTMGLERQSAVLRPYSAAGEYNFHRGVGLSVQKGKIEMAAFVSARSLSTSLATDTTGETGYFSSFQLSGYHRSATELEGRNNIRQLSAGMVVKYATGKWRLAVNGIWYHFSFPLQKRDEPYNMYAISGDRWYNFSVDYGYTFRNFHFFGEVAADMDRQTATVNGVLMSVDRKIDLSFLHRAIGKKYQAVNGNAFTENSYPSNENGFYAGIEIRPGSAWKINAYADTYTFPWLKYSVDAPSSGKDYMVQVTYTPGKQAELYTRFRNETKQANQPGNDGPVNQLTGITRQSWRTQCNYKINSSLTWRNRVEISWYDHKKNDSETGFLIFADLLYKPMAKPYAITGRLQYFETGGYDARMYAYENDVLYGYSIPVFFDNGFRYYLNMNYDLTLRMTCWLRWAQTIYKGKETIGSGADAIIGSRKSEVKFQVMYIF